MITKIIIDTGPIVAFLNSNDRYHEWAKEQLEQIKPPLLTCEAVLAETCFLLSKKESSKESLFELFHRELIKIPFVLNEETHAVKNLMNRYKEVPMSLADACLVRMSEQHSNSLVFTLDNDFCIYRRHSRQVIPTIIPK